MQDGAPPDQRTEGRRAARRRGAQLGVRVGSFVTSFRAVFDRDFLFLTSRPRFVLLRTALAILLVALTATVFLQSRSFDSRGQTVMFALTTAMTLLLAFLGPALAASSVAGERSLGTLDLILASPIGAFRFVLAKLLSRWAITFVFVLLVIPLLGLALLYGGVDGGTLLDGICLLASVGLWAVAGGVLVSAFTERVATAALGGFLISILVPVLHVIALSLIGAGTGRIGALLSHPLWATLTPGGAWFAYATSYVPGMARSTSIGLASLESSAVFAVVVVLVATWRVRREAGFAARSGTQARRPRRLLFENPTVARGLWSTLLSPPRVGGALFVLLVAALHVGFLVLGMQNGSERDWFGDLDETWPHVAGLLFATPVVSIATLAWAAPAVAHERQTGALDMISVSRLTDVQILLGPFVSVLARAAQALAIPATLGLLAALAPGCEFGLLTWFVWLVTTAIQVLLFTAIGLTFSCRSRTSKRAVVSTFGVVIGGLVVHLLAGTVIAIAAADVLEEGLFFWFCASPTLTVHMPTLMSTDDHLSQDMVVALSAAVLWNGVHLVVASALLGLLPKILDKSRE